MDHDLQANRGRRRVPTLSFEMLIDAFICSYKVISPIVFAYVDFLGRVHGESDVGIAGRIEVGQNDFRASSSKSDNSVLRVIYVEGQIIRSGVRLLDAELGKKIVPHRALPSVRWRELTNLIAIGRTP